MAILDCVTITPESADVFAPLIPSLVLKKLCEGEAMGIGSLLGDMPNGALVFRVEGNSAQILSLYVDEYDRGNGTGRFLVEKLRAILRENAGIYSIRAALPEEDNGAAAFFEALGARLEAKASGVTRFPLSALESSLLPAVPGAVCCISGEKLGQDRLAYYQRSLRKDGMDLMEEDLWEPPVRQDLSQYYLKGQTIQGCVVMTETERGLCLAMMVNQGDKMVLPALLCSLSRVLQDACPPETEISLEAVTPEMQKLVERLVPGAVRSSRRVAVLPL